jgi:hypothetical protein
VDKAQEMLALDTVRAAVVVVPLAVQRLVVQVQPVWFLWSGKYECTKLLHG